MIVGAGPVGLLLAQCAKLYLAYTWVSDMVDDRLALAREFGIEQALNPATDDIEARVREVTGGVGLDGLILTASGQPVWDQATRLVRDGGFIHLFAVKAGGAPTTVDLNAVLVHQIQVMSTYSSTPIAARESLDLISRGLIRVEELISHRLSLADLGHAVDMAVRREGRKIMIESE
jgi:threonine dehydrogenase-like Zn-dependent dehydrogenase